MATTLCAVCPAEGKDFEIKEFQLSDLRSDEVLVEIAAVGVCHTDIASQNNHIPCKVFIYI